MNFTLTVTEQSTIEELQMAEQHIKLRVKQLKKQVKIVPEGMKNSLPGKVEFVPRAPSSDPVPAPMIATPQQAANAGRVDKKAAQMPMPFNLPVPAPAPIFPAPLPFNGVAPGGK